METVRSQTIKFLNLYKSLRCLWDTSDVSYFNRKERRRAMEVLLVQYKNIEKSATLNSMKKKLENMRTSYKRERRKVGVLQSMSEPGPLYSPSLWYYEYLSFLHEASVRIELDPVEAENDNVVSSEDISENLDLTEEQKADLNEEYEEIRRKQKFNSEIHSYSRRPLTPTEEPQSSVVNDSVSLIDLKDQYSLFGVQIGLRIRDLPSSHARTVVKHLVSNILFEAEMGKYDNPHSCSSNCTYPSYHLPHCTQPCYSHNSVPENSHYSSTLPQCRRNSARISGNQNKRAERSPSCPVVSDIESMDSVLEI